MMTKIRHLRALQAFNLSAQYGSFSQAALMLSVSQGAISRQIKQLENYVSCDLFERTATGVMLTEQGRKLYSKTNQAFALFDEAFEPFFPPDNKRTLVISLAASLASKWLVPRLPEFRRSYPKINIFLDTTDDIVDFNRAEIDVALRYSTIQTNDDGLYWQEIAKESLILVAAPQFADLFTSAFTKNTVRDFPVLLDDFDNRWQQWLELSELQFTMQELRSVIQFRDSASMISAAISGQGLALVREIMVADDLKQGLLIRLDKTQIPLERSLHFVCRNKDVHKPSLKAFREWILVQ